MSRQTVIVVVLLLLTTAAMFAATRKMADDQADDALERRNADVAALITTTVGEVRSALGVLGGLADTPVSPIEFEAASAQLLSDSVVVVALLTGDDGRWTVEAASGSATRGDEVVPQLGALADQAIGAGGVVAAIVDAGPQARVAYALETPSSGRVVVRQAVLNRENRAPTLRTTTFGDVDFAVYATPEIDLDQVIRTTTDALPLDGHVRRQVVTVGASEWLVAVAAKSSLVGTLTEWSPWIALGVGLLVTGLVGLFVESLARRPAYALALVDERTAELQASLEERNRLAGQERRAREEAESANRSKSEFLSRMSHELRTPLNAVLGFAQLIELDDTRGEHQEAVVQILKGGRHLLDLINEVLDISRIETGNISLSPEPVLAGEVLTDAVGLVRPLAAERGIHVVDRSKPECDCHVLADRQRVQQILLNLLSNAVKYNRPGGTVAVSCLRDVDRLRIRVADTGPGIRPEDRGLLFAPFERLGAEHTDVEGLGIGLALSRRLAEAMGGTVDVESEPGKGSTFWVELPVVEGPVERYVRLVEPVGATPTPAGDGGGERRQILYIEDNLSNLKLVERLLERRPDIEVVAAMQGRLGLELAQQHQPVAILLDLHLPDVDGADVLRQLRDDPTTARIPVVVVSADATPRQSQRLLAAGAVAYLTKPLDVRVLVDLLDELLDAERG